MNKQMNLNVLPYSINWECSFNAREMRKFAVICPYFVVNHVLTMLAVPIYCNSKMEKSRGWKLTSEEKEGAGSLDIA